MPQQQSVDLTPALTASVHGSEQDHTQGGDHNQDVCYELLFLDSVILEVSLFVEGGDLRVLRFCFKAYLVAQQLFLHVLAEETVFELLELLKIQKRVLIVLLELVQVGDVLITAD